MDKPKMITVVIDNPIGVSRVTVRGREKDREATVQRAWRHLDEYIEGLKKEGTDRPGDLDPRCYRINVYRGVQERLEQVGDFKALVEVFCECGERVGKGFVRAREVETLASGEALNAITVSPCPECLRLEKGQGRSNGVKEGYDKGYARGYEEGTSG